MRYIVRIQEDIDSGKNMMKIIEKFIIKTQIMIKNGINMMKMEKE